MLGLLIFCILWRYNTKIAAQWLSVLIISDLAITRFVTDVRIGRQNELWNSMNLMCIGVVAIDFGILFIVKN